MHTRKMVLGLLFTLLLGCISVGHVVAQTGEIAPGDNLVVEGIPTIPGSLAEAVGRYTEFRAATLSGWHPTKREMLITTRFGDTWQIHQLKMPGGARTQLTFFRDNVFGGSYQPKHARYFTFSSGPGGNEFYQRYRYDLDTGAVTLLTDGKSRNTGPQMSPNTGRLEPTAMTPSASNSAV